MNVLCRLDCWFYSICYYYTWKRILLDKLLVPQLNINFPHFMEPVVSSPFWKSPPLFFVLCQINSAQRRSQPFSPRSIFIILIPLVSNYAVSLHMCSVDSIVYLASGLSYHKLNWSEGYCLYNRENDNFTKFSLTSLILILLSFLKYDFYYLFSMCFRFLL